MCGICGALGLSDDALLARMMASMRHRGPDSSGKLVDKNMMFGQDRLSIIDLKTGDQPIFNEDRSIAVILNGEIYNYRELRAELEKTGHKFETNSDTEVIPHLYEQFGPSFVSYLNGMFAFALWDSNKKQLLLARDRCGIKPLYYAIANNSLLFASEPKALLQHDAIKPIPDDLALHFFLNLRYIPGEMTAFKGIKKFPPAHYAVIDSKHPTSLKPIPYWHLPASRSSEMLPGFIDLLGSAVRRHMISDVPVGVYLSGGIDSTTIAYFARSEAQGKLKTFCMGFGEKDDELEDARKVADELGTDHREFVMHGNLLSKLPLAIWHADSPKRNLYPYYLANFASKHVKVVLSGLGGDELFAGYDYKYGKMREMAKKSKPEEAYLAHQSLDSPLPDEELAKIYGKKLSKFNYNSISSHYAPLFPKAGDMVDSAIRADFLTKMTDDFILVDDATSMASSIETRVPFLDHTLVDYSFSLPLSSIYSDGKGKLLLRRALSGKLPSLSIRKKKQGFASNTYSTYVKEIRPLAKRILPDGLAVKSGYIKKDYVSRILDSAPDPKRMREYNFIWNVLALEIWLKIYVERGDLRKPKLELDEF